MKIAGKITVAMVLGILGVMSLYAWIQVRNEVVFFDADAERTQRLGRATMIMINEIWELEGEPRLREMIDQADVGVPEITLGLVSLDAPAQAQKGPDLSASDLKAIAAGDRVVVNETNNDEPWRYVFVPLTVDGKHPAAVEWGESLQRQHTYVRMGHLAILGATCAIVLLCSLIAAYIHYRFIGNPLRLLHDKARRAGEGDFSAPLILQQHDEIGDLAAEINAMCQRIAEANQRLALETEARITALEQLRHTDRLATVGRLAAGVAHELGTPLNVVSARAQLIETNVRSEQDVGHHARIIGEQADRMTEIIQQLLDFSRRRTAKPGLANLQPVVTHTLDLLSSAAERSHVVLESEAPAEPLLAYIDQNQLQQALTNIILNGVHSMPNGGPLRVRLAVQQACPPPDTGGQEGDYFCISVTDQGTGIPREQLPRIFEPFFTTKGVGEGTGLGLAVAHGIVAEHGGWITVESVVGKGSCFSIFLPQPAGSRHGDLQIAS